MLFLQEGMKVIHLHWFGHIWSHTYRFVEKILKKFEDFRFAIECHCGCTDWIYHQGLCGPFCRSFQLARLQVVPRNQQVYWELWSLAPVGSCPATPCVRELEVAGFLGSTWAVQ